MSEIADSLFLDKYKEDNESVVAAVYNGSCGSCFYNLPAQSLQDTKKGKLITCQIVLFIYILMKIINN